LAVEVQTLPGLLPTHDQVVDAVLLSDVVQGADVGVVETGDGSCFSLKAFPQFGSL